MTVADADELLRLRERVAELEGLVAGLCDRCHRQSELLARRAGGPGAEALALLRDLADSYEGPYDHAELRRRAKAVLRGLGT